MSFGGFGLSSELASTPTNLVLHVGTQEYPFSDAVYNAGTFAYGWADNVPTWAESDSFQVKITGPPPPNAYGYRTIWTALMTVEENPNRATRFGYFHESYGKITNDTIVDGRTDRGVIDDQFRYPWSGYVIESLVQDSSSMDLRFLTNDYPTAAEVAGWTLSLGGGIELPFAKATNHALTPGLWSFNYDPGWADGDQVLVSIRTTYEVQNRFGQVDLKAGRSTRTDGNNNIIYGKTHYTCVEAQGKCPPKCQGKMSSRWIAMLADYDTSDVARAMGGLSAFMYFLTVSLCMPSSRAIPRMDSPLRFAFCTAFHLAV